MRCAEEPPFPYADEQLLVCAKEQLCYASEPLPIAQSRGCFSLQWCEPAAPLRRRAAVLLRSTYSCCAEVRLLRSAEKPVFLCAERPLSICADDDGRF